MPTYETRDMCASRGLRRRSDSASGGTDVTELDAMRKERRSGGGGGDGASCSSSSLS